MLRLSSTTRLSPTPKDDIAAFLRGEVAFQKRMGFDAVDFSMSIFENISTDLTAIAEEARDDAAAMGMRFEVCHLPFVIKKSNDLEEYRKFDSFMLRAIDAAKTLGVDFAVLHPTTVTMPADEFNRDMERDFVLKHLSCFVEHATKKGVTLAVENMGPVPEKYAIHRYCQNPDEICEVADALGTRVCWDFGHANMAGLKQSESLRHIGSRLAVLHVNDNFGGDDIHLPPFKGNIDWCDAMKGLTDIGFDGLFNFEISADKVPFEMRESFACYLIDSARKIMSYSEV